MRRIYKYIYTVPWLYLEQIQALHMESTIPRAQQTEKVTIIISIHRVCYNTTMCDYVTAKVVMIIMTFCR